MNRTRLLCPLVFLLASNVPGWAQSPQPPPPLISPEVDSDNRVTFRFRAPNAKEVLLAQEGAEPVPMQKDEQGVWSVTTHPLEPDFYGYSFVADGVRLIDPSNHLMKAQPAQHAECGARARPGLTAVGDQRRSTRHHPPPLLQVADRGR